MNINTQHLMILVVTAVMLGAKDREEEGTFSNRATSDCVQFMCNVEYICIIIFWCVRVCAFVCLYIHICTYIYMYTYICIGKKKAC